jgi:hypothetical protein
MYGAELIATDSNSNVVCFDLTGKEIWETRISGIAMSVWCIGCCQPNWHSLSDLTDSFTHSLSLSLSLSLSDLDQAPSIGDINGDGALDVVIATGKGHIWALYGLARAS